jgi:hypothetical protein
MLSIGKRLPTPRGIRQRASPAWRESAVSLLPLLALACVAGETNSAALKYEEPKFLAATIYEKDSDREKPLYRFKRKATRVDSRLTVVREFKYPDGKLAARERVIYDGDELVSYELEELQLGAKGSAKIQRVKQKPGAGALFFEYNPAPESSSKPKTRRERLRKDTLIADMVAPFLLSHWEALKRGDRVKCRYIVVPRMETVGFTFIKEAESTWQDRPVIVIKMQPSSPIMAALVEPLFFTIEKESPHRVLEYVGRTTPKVKAGNKWKDLDVVTVFEWNSERSQSKEKNPLIKPAK